MNFLEILKFLGQFDSVRIQDRELSDDQAPVVNWHGPSAGDIMLCKPEEFLQCFLVGENGGCFGNFSELPVEVLDGIGGIHDTADF